MSGTLYIIGTPIGNLEDITMRQLRLLGEVDFLAAEDTRVTRKILSHYDIHTPIVSYHEHSGLTVAQSIADRILAGESCGVVTDAGMPCISDPGEDLVRAAGTALSQAGRADGSCSRTVGSHCRPCRLRTAHRTLCL